MNRVTVVLLLALACVAHGFYLPGVAPRDYQSGEEVVLKVVSLDSVVTQLPYDHYSLAFCKPKHIKDENENLGEILAGERIETSLYEIRMRVDERCKVLCPPRKLSKHELAEFRERIEEQYRVNWIVDNLPAATKYYTQAEELGPDGQPKFEEHYEKGFALGFIGSGEPGQTPGVRYVNNHVRIILFYHHGPNFSGSRIVGFEVEPFSVHHKKAKDFAETNALTTCSLETGISRDAGPQPVSGLDIKKDDSLREIIWTYDVEWQSSKVSWASRWDLYLKMHDSKIHWFSIINSIMIVLFLTGMIAMIMMRTLHRDLLMYNMEQSEESQQEETGWKLIYGEVFRPPPHGGALSVLVGTGVQIIMMTVVTLGFAVLGFLSPANRGGLMTALLLLFVFMGVFAGYCSTRLYKQLAHTDWKRNTFWTAIFFPGFCFTIFFVLNLLVWGEKSSGAVPFGTLLALLVLWFGISVPLVYIGSYFAFKKPVEDPPVKVNNIPRMIPDQAWYMQTHFSVLVGGVLPFGAVFIEIFFIMSSVWLHQFYYVFGFLFIVFVILVITCAEISIVMTYFQLCGEDYTWWWRSFLTSGSSALYLFCYSILYFFTKLEIIMFVPGLLFFGYMFLVSFAFFLLTGTIGFYASYIFVFHIYDSVKIE